MTSASPPQSPGEQLEQLWQTATGMCKKHVGPTLNAAAPFVFQLCCSTGAYSLTVTGCHVLSGALRVHCATPVLGPAMGLTSVALASVVAGHVGRHVMDGLHEGRSMRDVATSLLLRPRGLDWSHALLDALLGPLFFKVSGGEFRRLLPSHLAKPGAFGYISVPTSAGNDYATAGEKSALVRAFRRDGCHHCGRWRAEVIGDHIPPYKQVKVAKEELSQAGPLMRSALHVANRLGLVDTSLTQVYYAQCRPCSNTQAQVMRALARATPARLRLWPSELRAHHWLRHLQRNAIPGALVGLRPAFDACMPHKAAPAIAASLNAKQQSKAEQRQRGASTTTAREREGREREAAGLWEACSALGGSALAGVEAWVNGTQQPHHEGAQEGKGKRK